MKRKKETINKVVSIYVIMLMMFSSFFLINIGLNNNTAKADATVPAVTTNSTSDPDITTTTAWIYGYLSDDGGEACRLGVQYGLNTSYGNNKNWAYLIQGTENDRRLYRYTLEDDFVGSGVTTPQYLDGVGGDFYNVITDGEYVYGAISSYVYRFDPYTLASVSPTINYGGSVLGLVQDDEYLYLGGGGDYLIRKYWKSNMTLALNATVPYSNGAIRQMAIDDSYIYVIGGSSSGSVVAKYSKSDLSFVINSTQGTLYDYGACISVDDTYVFIGEHSDGSHEYLYKFWKSNLTYIGHSVEFQGHMFHIEDLGDKVACGGCQSYNAIRIFWKSNLTNYYDRTGLYYCAETTAQNDTYFFVGASDRFYLYWKSNWSIKYTATGKPDGVLNGDALIQEILTDGHEFKIYLTNLQPSTWYHYRTFATNSNGTSYGSDTTFLTEALPPDNLTATTISTSSINVSWVNTGNSTWVERNTVSSWNKGEGTFLYNGTNTSFLDTGRKRYTVYYYQAWSWDQITNTSDFQWSVLYGSANNRTFAEVPVVQTNDSSVIYETDAEFEGYIVDDGGETCTVWFEYGTDTGYGINTTTTTATNGSFSIDSLTFEYLTYYGISGNVYDVEWSDDGTYFAGSSTSYTRVYKRSGDTLNLLQTLASGYQEGISFAPNASYLSIRSHIYKRSGDTFTELTDPFDTAPVGTIRGTCFSPDGNYLAISIYDQEVPLYVYRRDDDNFTQLTIPLQGYWEGKPTWSPDSKYLVVKRASTSAGVVAYIHDGDVFTRLTSNLPCSVEEPRFSSNGKYFALFNPSVCSRIMVYKFLENSFLFNIAGGGTPGQANGGDFAWGGRYVIGASISSPYHRIYRINDDDTITWLPDIQNTPNYGLGARFSPDNTYLAIGANGRAYLYKPNWLVPGTLYHYRAVAMNSNTTDYGDDKILFTRPYKPDNFETTSETKTSINLSWTKGYGAYKTVIRGKLNDYPTSISDGISIYNGTGNWTVHSSLTTGDKWYYSAWSYVEGSGHSAYSIGNREVSHSTLVSSNVSTNISVPVTDEITTLQGFINDDGGRSSIGGFEYGEDTSYGETAYPPEGYIYAGGNADTVGKYYAVNLTLITSTASYGGDIYDIAQDDDYIYVVGNTNYTVKQYWKSNMTLKAFSANYGSVLHAVAVDDIYVYAGGDSPYTVNQYWKSNLTLKQSTPSYGNQIDDIVVKGNLLYANGFNIDRIRIYYIPTMEIIGASADLQQSYAYSRLVVDEDGYVYGRYSGDNIEKFAIAFDGSIDLVATSPTLSGWQYLYEMLIVGDYIYIAGGDNNYGMIAQLWRSNLSIKNTKTYADGDPIYGMTVLGNYIYIYHYNDAITKYHLDDLTTSVATVSTSLIRKIIGELATYSTGESFSANVELSPNKVYHYRSFATNDNGTAYGEDRAFPPIIQLINPQNGSLLDRQNYSNLTIFIDGFESTPITVEFYNASSDTLLNQQTGGSNNQTYYYNWTNLPPGRHYWYVYAYSSTQNKTSTLWNFVPNDEPTVKNLRLEEIGDNSFSLAWENEPNMEWVSLKVGNEFMEVRKILGYYQVWNLSNLFKNTEYNLQWQLGDNYTSMSDYYDFDFRTNGWNDQLENFSYRQLITIENDTVGGSDLENYALNLTLTDDNFQTYAENWWDPVYPAFIHLNYTSQNDIRLVNYYDMKFLPFNITSWNVPGNGGISEQVLPNETYYTGSFGSVSYAHDGDWLTQATPAPYGVLYYNYTEPAGAKTSSKFRAYQGEWIWDVTLPEGAFGGSELRFKSECDYNSPYIATYVWNYTSSDWDLVANSTARYFYESQMSWEYDVEVKILVKPEHFNDAERGYTYGIDADYDVKLWLYYGNPDAINNETSLSYAGVSDASFTLGGEEERVLAPPVISNVQETDKTATSINISWETDLTADGRIKYATNPWFFGSVWASQNVNRTDSFLLTGNETHTEQLYTYSPYFVQLVDVTCSNSTFSNNASYYWINSSTGNYPAEITFNATGDEDFLYWNVTYTYNKTIEWATNTPSFSLVDLPTNTTYYYQINATNEGGTSTYDGDFTLGTLPSTPHGHIEESLYDEDRPNATVTIVGNLTDMNGQASVTCSIQHWNESSTDFSETTTTVMNSLGTFSKTINVDYGHTYYYRMKMVGSTGYSEVYSNDFMEIQEFFAGSYIEDKDNNGANTDYRQREYRPTDPDGTVNLSAQAYEQYGYWEGSLQEEDWMWVETNISDEGTLTLHLYTMEYGHVGDYQMNVDVDSGMRYLKLTNLNSSFYTFYITGNSGMVLNWTKPSLIHRVNESRVDESKYVSFDATPEPVNYTLLYMDSLYTNESAYRWAIASGLDLYSAMGVEYFGGGLETGLSEENTGTAYDRGQLFRGGVWNGEPFDTGALNPTRNDKELGAYRYCFAFTNYWWNTSLLPSNNITNYYYRYWSMDKHWSDYLGYPQDRLFDFVYLMQFKYDEISYTRDWKAIDNTTLYSQLTVDNASASVFGSDYDQNLLVGFKNNFSFNPDNDQIWNFGIYFDGRWTNQQVGQYQQAFVIFNLPDNATLQGMDSDSDNINDYDELFVYYTNPKSNDTDEDGFDDGLEIQQSFTDPNIYTDNPGPPQITINEPDENDTFLDFYVDVDVDINSYYNFSYNISVWEQGGALAEIIDSNTTSTNVSFSGFWDSTSYDAGWYELKVNATDEFDQYVEDSVPFYRAFQQPIVTTNNATGVEETNATLNGTLVYDGGENCTCRFEYGTTESYGSFTYNQSIAEGTNFAVNVSSLDPGQLYRYRAIANNTDRENYGDDKAFLTKPYKPVSITATRISGTQINLNWTAGEGANNTYIEFSTSVSVWTRGEGTPIYNGSLLVFNHTSLTPGYTYNYQAWSYAEWTYNPTVHQWSDENSSDNQSTLSTPTVTTNDATLVEETTSRLNGILDNDGGETCTVWFSYGLTPSLGTNTSGQSKTTGQSFYADLSSLQQGKLYYFKAVADNSIGTVNGSIKTFLTKPEAPTSFDVYTDGENKINLTWITGTGANTTYIERNATGVTTPWSRGTGTMIYNGSNISYTDTLPSVGVTYYYQAWSYVEWASLNHYSDSYASDSAISASNPNVTTNASTLVEETTARFNGFLIYDGGEACTVRFEYGFNDSFGSFTSNQSKTTGNIFYVDVSSLQQGKLYYFRAVANNSVATVYGDTKIFLTKPNPPSSFDAYPDGEAQINLSWNKGAGANTTYIERNASGITTPWAIGTGDMIYNDTGTTYGDGGRNENTTYYYQAWSYTNWSNLHWYSDNNVSDYSVPPGNLTVVTYDATAVHQELCPGGSSYGGQATLHGYLATDGGERCDVGFEWGTTASYGHSFIGETLSWSRGFSSTADEDYKIDSNNYYWGMWAKSKRDDADQVWEPFCGVPINCSFKLETVGNPIGTISAVIISRNTDDVITESINSYNASNLSFSHGWYDFYFPGNAQTNDDIIYVCVKPYFSHVNSTDYISYPGYSAGGSNPTVYTGRWNNVTKVWGEYPYMVGDASMRVYFNYHMNSPADFTWWVLCEDGLSSTGQTYHYRAIANNSLVSTYGEDKMFFIPPLYPNYFYQSGTKYYDRIRLFVSQSTSQDKTYIERRTTPGPWARGEGTFVCNQSIKYPPSVYYTDTGLQSNTYYYYQAWGWAEDEGLGGFSPNYISASSKTLSYPLELSYITPPDGDITVSPSTTRVSTYIHDDLNEPDDWWITVKDFEEEKIESYEGMEDAYIAVAGASDILGQTFYHTGGNFWATSISLPISAEASDPNYVTNTVAKIWSTTGTPAKPSAVLATSVSQDWFYHTDKPDFDTKWVTIPFTTPYQLVSGTTYAITLQCSGSYGTNYLKWDADAFSSAYNRGNRIESLDGGSTWTVNTTGDMIFRINGDRTYHTVFRNKGMDASPGNKTCTISGLQRGRTYYWNVYATNIPVGTETVEENFTFCIAPTACDVTTTAGATDVQETTATLSANLVDDGDKKTRIYFEYSYANKTYNQSTLYWTTSSIASGLTYADDLNAVIDVFRMNGAWNCLIGTTGTISGFTWNGATWGSNSAIVAGLPTSYTNVAPKVFEIGGIHYCIVGELYGSFSGYRWNGVQWITDGSILSGLSSLGGYSQFEIVELNDEIYGIASGSSFVGYKWTGSSWMSDSSIVLGLTTDTSSKRFTSYDFYGELKGFTGEYQGYVDEFSWNGTAWVEGDRLTDIGRMSAPCVFFLDDQYHLIILGNEDGTNDNVVIGSTFPGWAYTSPKTFSSVLSGLSAGTLYWYRAVANNTLYEDAGAEYSFLTKPYEPPAIYINAIDSTTLELLWYIGDGSNNTRIERKKVATPWARGTGTLVYEGPNETFVDTNLERDTTYYYQAWGKATWASYTQYSTNYISETNKTYASQSIIITSLEATGVEETNATLNAYMTFDGYEKCEVWFQYGLTPGFGSTTSYSSNVRTGESVSKPVSGLQTGKLYYFRAVSDNPYVETSYGLTGSFLLKPSQPPQSFTVSESKHDEIEISWSKGLGATKTLIIRKEGSYPTSRTDGEEVYNGTANSFTDTELDSLTQYYYRAWSVSVGSHAYSDGYSDGWAWTLPSPPTNLVAHLVGANNLNMTWTSSVDTNITVLVFNETHYPTSVTDGTIVYNGTLETYLDTDIISPIYYSAFAWINYSNISFYSEYAPFAFGGMFVNCYDEETFENLTFDIFVTNEGGTDTYTETDCVNTLMIATNDLPFGNNIAIQVSADNHATRYYYRSITEDNWYDVNAYLPNLTTAQLYLITVINQYDFPIEGVSVKTKTVDETGTYVEVSSLLTDANGQVSIYLIPGKIYKWELSRFGYITAYPDYIPSSQIFTHTFRLDYTEDVPEEEEGLFDALTWEIVPEKRYHTDGFMAYFNITSATNQLETFRWTIHYQNETFGTWQLIHDEEVNNSPSGGSLHFYIVNNTGEYHASCYFKKFNFTETELTGEGGIRVWFISWGGLETSPVFRAIPDWIYLLIIVIIMIIVMAFLLPFAGLATGYIGLGIFGFGLALKPDLALTVGPGDPISGWLIFVVTAIVYTLALFIWSRI